MDTRNVILEAALALFAEAGSRGATTRRIAAAAGVNEVTLFRHFGSKEALLEEALRHASGRAALAVLPAEPVSPHAELGGWCVAHLEALTAARSLLRASFSEFESSAGARGIATDAPARMTEDLKRYIVRLQELRLARPEVEPAAAAAMLMGSLVADAISRDLMPDRYPYSVEEGAMQYAALFLRAVGSPEEKD